MAISAQGLLTTASLRSRPPRRRDWRGEVEAMNAMIECTLRDPDALQQCFVDCARRLCDAGSAGISMLERTDAGALVFRWTALSGQFASFVGGSTPRESSPCGLCLDANGSILVSWPVRVFSYLAEAPAPIVEGLIVPLYDADGAAVGTIWIAAHDEARQFDATDAAVMEEIAGFFTRACRIAGDAADQRARILKLDATLAKEKTKRRRAEDELRQAIKMEAMGRLTGGIAHDFNNVLTVVMGIMELLKEQPERDPQQIRRLAERALSAAGRGERLVRQLLAFARREALRPATVDLKELVHATSEMLARSLGEGRIELKTALPKNLWPVHVDRDGLEMAVVNIAVNARDAMPDGGTISLGAENVTYANAVVNEEVLRGDYVALTIADTGVGMPAEVLARACEPFFTTKETGKGTGLGLSTVFGFVKQSGGALKVDSEVGRGTALTLYLPRAAAPIRARVPSGDLARAGSSESSAGSGDAMLNSPDAPAATRAIQPAN
jgi:signal transduction histidine kinase